MASEAAKIYIKEIQEGHFPEEKHTFSIDEEIINKLY
jgi:3-methyl-2-oxobutanoate hydroxymethyltransferase